MADTGQGATIAASVTSLVGTVKSISLPDFQIETLEKSSLATTDFKEYVKTDLREPGEITVEVYFDAKTQPLTYTSGTNVLTVFGVPQTVTVTFPKTVATNTTAATLAGTGFITGIKLPELQMGELQMATYTIAFDGDTGPTFTVEAA